MTTQPAPKSNILTKAINKPGLTAIVTPTRQDMRPLSFYIAATLVEGGEIGELEVPQVDSTLYVEGAEKEEDLVRMLEASSLNTDLDHIHLLSFSTINSIAEATVEDGIFLNNPPGRESVLKMAMTHGAKVVIIHTLTTASNHFLSGSEKDIYPFIRQLNHSGIGVVIFAEQGTKGVSYLKSIADVVLDIACVDSTFDSVISIECTKCQALGMKKPQPFCLSLSEEDDGQWTVTSVDDPQQIMNQAIAMACAEVTQEKIGAALGLEQYQVSRILSKALKKGLITKVGRKVSRA